MKDVMIDIETLGLTSDSVILSIAAVEFDWQTGDTGREFYEKFLPYQLCRHKCPETKDWWMTQPTEVFAEATNGTMILQVGLTDFANWFGEDQVAWSQGFDFDLSTLSDAFGQYGISTPWKYSAKRDTRTVYHVCGLDPKSIEREGAHHNALADCHHQIKCVVAAMKKIKAIQ